VATISASFITGGGDAQCQPITRSGRSVAAASAAIGKPEVLEARVELAEDADLLVESLGHALHDEIRGRGHLERRGPGESRERRLHLAAAELPARDRALEPEAPRDDVAPSALERLLGDVAADGLVAAGRERLRDAAAHDSRADHADAELAHAPSSTPDGLAVYAVAMPLVSAADARTLFLHAQGLCDDPARRASTAAVAKLVDRLGFVQVDSIQRIERAHHLILGARLDGYRPEFLERLAFEKRALFEHWTHDAAYIPVALFPHWKHRFVRRERKMRSRPWFKTRLGRNPDRTIARVLARVEREGALRARDFERAAARRSEGWWDWTPEKTALEVLWQSGRLAIAGRDGFDKIYDLVERVLPEAHAAPASHPEEHVDWACSSALERLGAATPSEIAAFWGAVTPAEAAAWCREAPSRHQAVSVQLGAAKGAPRRPGLALPDWDSRVHRAPALPDELRLLAPFDPVLRDRDRLTRLFDFDYRFEAFTPARKRRYGYYVLPILERDRFVGRLDPRHDRARETLVVDGVWWEPHVRPTAARKRALGRALEKLAARIGAKSLELSS
jgi:uncharacterized protein YcaQ